MMERTRNLIHHWKTSTDPNAGSGALLTDQTGNGNAGTINDGFTWDTDPELSIPVLNPNGVDGQILFDSTLSLTTVDNTVGLWVKPKDPPGIEENWFVLRFTSGDRAFLQNDNAGRIVALWYPGSNRVRRSSAALQVADEWLSVMATYNSALGDSPLLYVNGVQPDATTTGGQGSSVFDRMVIGGRTQDPTVWPIRSLFGELSIWTNRILTADEAAIWHANGPGPRVIPVVDPLPGTICWFSPDLDPNNPNPTGLLRDINPGSDVDGYFPNGGLVQSQPGFGGDLAVRFDGTPVSTDQQHSNHSDVSVFDGLRAFSISGWYKSAGNNQNNSAHTLAAKYSPSGQLDDRCFVLNVNNSNGQWFSQVATDADGVFSLTANKTTTVTDWNHVCVTWDGATMRMFVNNENAGSTPANDGGGLRPNSRPFTVGRSFNNFNANGWIDDLRFFDRALAESEVEDLFSSRGYQPGFFVPAVAIQSTRVLG